MSWSVSAVGSPASVKASVEKQFASAKSHTTGIPHEHRAVEAIENIVNGEIDFLSECKASPGYKILVKVEASGSAYRMAEGQGSSQVSLKVEPFYVLE